MHELQRITERLLNPASPAHSLRPEVLQLSKILTSASSNPTALAENGSSGETQTPNGLAISPGFAARCADDFVRTIEFVRGTHEAIGEVRKLIPNRPARILYVGCGPLATLAVPLMTAFTPAAATFTLIDLHADSIESAKCVVTTLGLAASVVDFVCGDAMSYCLSTAEAPDLLLLETMQACLEREPQVAIARHLLKQSPEAILLPQEVRIDLNFVDLSREFDWSNQPPPADLSRRDRLQAGAVFVLNRYTIKSWEDHRGAELPAAVVTIPDQLETRYEPLLFTTIRVYGDHVLKDYDSGLTYPRRPTIVGTMRPGDSIQFHYELGSRPGLRGQVTVAQRVDPN